MSDKGLETNEEYMLQIGDTLISLDVIERDFICNLSACRGACCIEGDAGAPITEEERLVLMKLLPEVWNDLTPAAREIIKSQGVAYVDEEGDLVTSIVGGKDCVFTCYGEDGMCMCAIEKAYREGRVCFLDSAFTSTIGVVTGKDTIFAVHDRGNRIAFLIDISYALLMNDLLSFRG